MEENNYHEDCYLCKHPALKCIIAGLLIFLGAFCASYVVSDWHFKRMFNPVNQIHRMERDMIKQERNMNRMLDKEFQRPYNKQFVKIEKFQDAYKIVIDLKPFDNDEKNIEIKTDKNTLTISGEKNSKNKKEIMRFNQTFSFGDEIKTDEITKVREGDNYIITVPVD